MIRIDNRIGSVELAKPLKQLGLTVKVTRLEYGDASFSGHGPESLVRVGIERKKIADLLACMYDNRFAGRQLPGLLEEYDVVYLLLEGAFRPDRSGLLQVRRSLNWSGVGQRRLMYSDFDHFLGTIEQKGCIIVRRAITMRETVFLMHSLYSWWKKPWEKHQSLRPMLKRLRCRVRDTAKDDQPEAILMGRASLFRKVLAQLPHVGWERSKAAEGFFKGDIQTAVCAGVRQWEQVQGIGSTLAAQIVASLTSSEKPRGSP